MTLTSRMVRIWLLGASISGAVGAAESCLIGSNRLGPATLSAVSGSIAYLVAGSALVALDISEPSTPQVLSRLDLDFAPYEIGSSGSVDAIAAGDAGLVLIDTSDPKKLRIAGRLVFDGLAVALALRPPLAIVALDGGWSGGGGLLVINISVPDEPTLQSFTLYGVSGAVEVTAWNNYVFASGLGVGIFDISDPTEPVQVGTYFRGGWEMLVSPSGRRLYSLTQSNPPQDSCVLDVIDVSNPKAPFHVTTIPGFPDCFEGLAAGGGYFYTVDREDGLLAYDVGDETGPPTLAGSLPGARSTSDLVLAGSLLLSSEPERGLSVVDLSVPAAPMELARYATPSASRGVRASGTIAYVRTDTSLRLLDISNPQNLVDLSFFETDARDPTYAWPPADLLVVNGLVYLPDFGGVRIVNVATPENPVELAYWSSPYPARSVAISGTTLYVGLNTPPFDPTPDPALYVIDVSDPSSPAQIDAREDDGWWPERLLADDGLLFATDPMRTNGCWIFDITEPAVPTRIASCDLGPSCLGLRSRGDYLFQACTNRFSVLDVSAPTSPTLVGTLASSAPSLWGVEVRGDRSYLAHQDEGLHVVDITTLSQPALLGTIDTPGRALDVALLDDLILVADEAAGISIYSDCVLFSDGFESENLSAWSLFVL